LEVNLNVGAGIGLLIPSGSVCVRIFRIKEPSALSVRNFQNKRTAGFRVFAEKSDSKNHQFQVFQTLQRTTGLHERLSGYRQIFEFLKTI
jgi:hypothetical protein